MKAIYRKLPTVVKNTLLVSEGWLVGGAMENILNEEAVRDYDIVVPNRELFQLAVALLHSSVFTTSLEINSYGGLKFKTFELEIDIWCEELDHFLRNATNVAYVFNFKKLKLLKLETI